MRKIFLSIAILAGLASQASAADNYNATAGSGLVFGAKDAAGVLYSRFIGCDNTTVSQCWTINASGQLAISAASGSFASGAFASGSMASGSMAAGAMVDLLTMRGTVAAGTAASNALLTGCIYNSTPITLTNGQGSATQCSANGYPTVVVSNTNANGQATMANSSPVTIASNQTANALWGHGATGAAVPANATYFGFNSGGNLTAPSTTAPLPVNNTGPYPIGATPYTATATGTTGATTATLAGASSVTTYICGFSIRANATAAATGNATVTGVITATLNFTQWTAPNASGLGVTEMIFSPCIPASATNTSIAVVSAAPGTGGVVSVTAWGYKL